MTHGGTTGGYARGADAEVRAVGQHERGARRRPWTVMGRSE